MRPALRKVIDRQTGDTHKLVIPCGSTREYLCPPCATRAQRLRMQQCEEGWHLDEIPCPTHRTRCQSFPSPRTIKDVRTVLRSALGSAMREELVERNVAVWVKIPKQRRRKVVPWTTEEARRFLESARADRDPLLAAYVLVLGRKGEVLGLTWPAVDLEKGTFVIDHQLQRIRRELVHRETKTEASDAELSLPDLVVQRWRNVGPSSLPIEMHLARHGGGYLRVRISSSPGGPGHRLTLGR